MRNLLPIAFLIGGRLFAEPTDPNVTQALRPPSGQILIAHFSGKGKQIYMCQRAAATYSWKLKAPEAQLYSEDGKLVGHHFAGPTWEATDGSRVTGRLVTSVPSPDSNCIPWLLLTVIAHEGRGIMNNVQTIQRLNTRRGVAPSGGCDAALEGQETSVPYEADYYFYGTP